MPPVIFLPKRKVVVISLVYIRLPLERYVLVGILFEQTENPFEEIQDIETDIQELPHLLGVYLFVANHHIGQRLVFLAGKDKAEDVYSAETLKRKMPRIDYFFFWFGHLYFS